MTRIKRFFASKGVWDYMWFFIAAVYFIFYLCSCNTSKHIAHKRQKQTAKLDKIKAKCDADKDLVTVPPMWCASQYKPVSKTNTITKYLPGKPIKVPGATEYVTVDCDSVVNAANLTYKTHRAAPHIVKVPVPVYLEVDTSAIVRETERENVAEVIEKGMQIDSLEKVVIDKAYKMDKAETSVKEWRGRTLWTWGIVFLVVGTGIGIKVAKNKITKKIIAAEKLV